MELNLSHDLKLNQENKFNIYYKEVKILEKKLHAISNISDNLIFRLLEVDDINKSYFDLLSELTISPVPDLIQWKTQLESLKNSNTFIIVIEDKSKNIIVGNITCLIEEKFIRNLGRVSHIEDVVVHSDYRKIKLGSKLVNLIIDFSREIGCYKIILDGRLDAYEFYKKFGFEKKFNCMGCYPNKEK